MVAQLRSLPALLAVLVLAGCQGGGDAATSKAMSTPSAVNGPKIEDWAKANPDNGRGGHIGEK